MVPDRCRCLLVTRDEQKKVFRAVVERPLSEWPAGDVLIRVAYSSLNYKDALSASGHGGVTRKYPHVPGIDAAGTVVESSDSRFAVGEEVLVTGFDLGQNTWGGFSEYVRVPAGWVVKLPQGLSLKESMIYGTAGFTAGLAVEALIENGVKPASGEIVVTGASGGVGSIAVALLGRLGYKVVAVTGKPAAQDMLRGLGAMEFLTREQAVDTSEKPLLAGRWAGAVDTVGGSMLATVIRSAARGACITASGLVGGAELPLTVFPFILRGVKLVGIDSAEYPIERRPQLWAHLAGGWRSQALEKTVAGTVSLSGLEPRIADILAGKVQGRVLVDPTAKD